MKKKIALFLAAALLSVGLIVSCGGGGDDDEDGPGPGTNPTGGEYTVTFDTDGGDPATIEPIKVKAGTAIGAATWPANPTRDTDVFGGWFDGTTPYTASTKIEKNVALKAKYTPFVWPTTTDYVTALGAITWKNNASQQGWRANGVDDIETPLEWEDIQYAKYLVLHTKGGTDATLGDDADDPGTWETQFNGIQFVAQGDGNGWSWSQTNLNAVEFARAANKDVYIVIDTHTLKRFNDIVGGTKGKIIIAYWNCVNMFQGLGLQEAYLTNKDLAKPADAVEITSNGYGGKSGFVTATNILGLTAPTTTYTVTFNTDGGTPTIDPIVVGEGKYLGVRYPDWSKKEGYDFAGWFDGTTEIKADTVITANVTVKAKWKVAYKFDDINNAVKIGGTYENENAEWGINGKFPFKYFIVATFLNNRGGVNGIQFGVQGKGVPQKIKVTGDWTGISTEADEIVYFIIDVTTFSSFNDDLFAADWAQFRINYGGKETLGKYQGYVATPTTLTKPDGAVDFSGTTSNAPSSGGDTPLAIDGYVTKTLPTELQ